jgi:hypothetical protein
MLLRCISRRKPRSEPGFMRALLVSTVATGVLLLGLMGAHTATPPPGASSALDRTPAARHAGPNALPVMGRSAEAQSAS